MNRIRSIATLLLVLGSTSIALGEEPLEYNRDIRPILAENCFACHGADSASRKAELRLDRREEAVDAGAIAPGDAGESELIARILSDDPDLLMPPAETKKVVTPQQRELLQRWIDSGAEYQPHWSFIAPRLPEPPAVNNEMQVRNVLDRFIFARLQKEGLTPAAEADARTLFRRLHLDITGLPPKPTDLAAFVADYELRKDLALSAWIDRLMESTAWGEHRARYWLDAARYADTHGLHFDNYREMWPYRDWVIRAFNANQPFDQFILEQLAGDLLAKPSDDQLIATGFQRCNITTNEGGTIDAENLAIYATDRVQTFGWVFLGLTTNCAQCHDHKFDPLTMRDFYSLAAFFGNTTSPAKDGNTKDGKGPVLLVPSEADRPRWESLPAEIAAAKSQRDERKKQSTGDFEKWLIAATPSEIPGVPNEGLVLHLPLDEGKGDEVRNLAGSTKSFRAESAVEWQAGGKLGSALRIKEGSTLNLGDLGDFEKDQAFSYGAWVMTPEKVAKRGVNAAILARMDEANGHRGWDLWQSGNTLSVHLIDSWDGNALKVSTKQDVVVPGKWQYAFVTYDGSADPSGIKIYLDGVALPLRVAKNTLQENATIRAKTPLRIGQRSSAAVFEGGLVQEVRIYDRLLDDDEVGVLAKAAEVRAVLAKAAGDRSKEEQNVLHDYFLVTSDEVFAGFAQALQNLEAEQVAIRQRSPVTLIQKEKSDSPPMANILLRGAYDRVGEEVNAATPAALHSWPEGAPHNRLGLAMWVVDRSNPLTARVTVNRFWQEIFGRGIVETPEDFGTSGSLPSHPELIDWLACDFVESGWNVQRFFKQIFMSASYRQAAATTLEKLERDPENILLSRGPRFRMDAEMVRDTALSVSGLLSPRMYGPGTRPYQPSDIWNVVGLSNGDTRIYKQDQGENLYRRTLYNFWKRMAPSPNMEAFNAPSREVCTVHRERTNTPLQALITLNDPQFVEAARRLAENALRASSGDESMTLSYIVERVLSRPLTPNEQTLVLTAQKDYLGYYQKNPDDAVALIHVGDSKPDADLGAATLAAWTMVCNQVLNLDEALNK
ncbi:MAG: DUF1553 domain-containing protein [Planctomycetes bacterium]|nr:DUF1553 domain-containing protein [Planctomycetota bacterium]